MSAINEYAITNDGKLLLSVILQVLDDTCDFTDMVDFEVKLRGGHVVRFTVKMSNEQRKNIRKSRKKDESSA